MDAFIKLFGFNAMNFWGWIVAGLMLLALSVYFLVQAILTPKWDNPTTLLLASIAVLLVGVFGVLLQIYCGIVADRLERERRRDE